MQTTTSPQGEPLRRYFHGLYSEATLSAFEANMYLAEDRILCLEIVVKKGDKYRCDPCCPLVGTGPCLHDPPSTTATTPLALPSHTTTTA